MNEQRSERETPSNEALRKEIEWAMTMHAAALNDLWKAQRVEEEKRALLQRTIYDALPDAKP